MYESETKQMCAANKYVNIMLKILTHKTISTHYNLYIINNVALCSICLVLTKVLFEFLMGIFCSLML